MAAGKVAVGAWAGVMAGPGWRAGDKLKKGGGWQGHARALEADGVKKV